MKLQSSLFIGRMQDVDVLEKPRVWFKVVLAEDQVT